MRKNPAIFGKINYEIMLMICHEYLKVDIIIMGRLTQNITLLYTHTYLDLKYRFSITFTVCSNVKAGTGTAKTGFGCFTLITPSPNHMIVTRVRPDFL